MSGKVAQGAGKAVQQAKAIDWDYLQKVVVSESGKRELAALRRAYDDVAATINEKFNIVSSFSSLICGILLSKGSGSAFVVEFRVLCYGATTRFVCLRFIFLVF
jgi:hypothetical protein